MSLFFWSRSFSSRLQSSVCCDFVWAQSLPLHYRSDWDLFFAWVSFLALTDLDFTLPRFRCFQELYLISSCWLGCCNYLNCEVVFICYRRSRYLMLWIRIFLSFSHYCKLFSILDWWWAKSLMLDSGYRFWYPWFNLCFSFLYLALFAFKVVFGKLSILLGFSLRGFHVIRRFSFV